MSYLCPHKNTKTFISMLDVKKTIKDVESRMELTVLHLEDTFDHIRAGRAAMEP